MADLPTIADRMNDVEVSANAPITETLMRRFGSNINFILDFLGVTDGSTSPTGDLSDLTNALTVADANSYDLQQTFAGNAGVVSIGTYSSVKYLNQVFYLKVTAGGNGTFENFNANAGGSRFYTEANIDSSGFFELTANQLFPFAVNAEKSKYDLLDATFQINSPDANKFKGTKALNVSTSTSLQAIINDTNNPIIPIAEIDWRDGSSVDLRVFCSSQGAGTNTFEVYRGYRLNIGSGSISF